MLIFRRVLQFPGAGFSFDLKSTRGITETKQRDHSTGKTWWSMYEEKNVTFEIWRIVRLRIYESLLTLFRKQLSKTILNCMNSQFLILFSVVKPNMIKQCLSSIKWTLVPRKRKGTLAQYQSPDKRTILLIIRAEKSCSDRSNFPQTQITWWLPVSSINFKNGA